MPVGFGGGLARTIGVTKHEMRELREGPGPFSATIGMFGVQSQIEILKAQHMLGWAMGATGLRTLTTTGYKWPGLFGGRGMYLIGKGVYRGTLWGLRKFRLPGAAELVEQAATTKFVANLGVRDIAKRFLTGWETGWGRTPTPAAAGARLAAAVRHIKRALPSEGISLDILKETIEGSAELRSALVGVVESEIRRTGPPGFLGRKLRGRTRSIFEKFLGRVVKHQRYGLWTLGPKLGAALGPYAVGTSAIRRAVIPVLKEAIGTATFRTVLKTGIMHAARVGGWLMNAAILGELAYSGAKLGVTTMIGAANRMGRRIPGLEMGTGVLQAAMTRAAVTERQAAIQAISGSRLNARRFLGNEAAMYHAVVA